LLQTEPKTETQTRPESIIVDIFPLPSTITTTTTTPNTITTTTSSSSDLGMKNDDHDRNSFRKDGDEQV